ncbi:MAG: cupin domain-containing protein [Bdellovibrionales bacterium]
MGRILSAFILVFTWNCLASATQMPMTLVRYKEVLSRTPDIEGQNIRVWNIRQTDQIRVNLVEVSGELTLHKHPDADHSLMVLKGRLRVQVGGRQVEVEEGDFVSIPADVPHKYWPLDGRPILVSMDAPYYDPGKTINLE